MEDQRHWEEPELVDLVEEDELQQEEWERKGEESCIQREVLRSSPR